MPAGGFWVEGWKLCIRGVPRGQIFSGFHKGEGFEKKGKVLGFRGISPSLVVSGVKFLAMDSFFWGV